MYEDRRRTYCRVSRDAAWVKQQLYLWKWESHLWGDKQCGDGITQQHCVWCEWVPPTEYPLSEATPLCKQNPAIQKLLGQHLELIGERIDCLIKGEY